ncbi:hypothetical protein ELE36_04335 [Pseudolysobacter antarcticus]|uniref:Uncharacterized protein n=1 Tax=Pseudolysobacter antarcticus TaxID=2511995 RepID=A0A411HGU8_9GAMM|nr:hypothetical protein [Pseudolysobacter antarcticus]QBB69664.1 hypothetical protein ELE36_04335 [Pseudolysobacter antarcticus]
MTSSEPLDLAGLFADGPIERVAAKYRFGEEPSEVELWSRFSAEQRLAALIALRARHLMWKYGIEPRLERVLAITRQA